MLATYSDRVQSSRVTTEAYLMFCTQLLHTFVTLD